VTNRDPDSGTAGALFGTAGALSGTAGTLLEGARVVGDPGVGGTGRGADTVSLEVGVEVGGDVTDGDGGGAPTEEGGDADVGVIH
jgi:hypothetical protein